MSTIWDIQIDNYEGPLDLLIHLVHKNEMNIFDVPILEITNHFVEEIRRMQSMEVEIAADFIQMASYLIYLKSRSLLPISRDLQEELSVEEEELHFAQLLVDLAYCKDLAVRLKECSDLSGRYFVRRESFMLPRSEKAAGEPFSLADAFFGMLEYKPEEKVVIQSTKEYVGRIAYRAKDTLLERRETLWSFLAKIFPAGFEQAVAFSTVLEMSKQGLIHSIQDGNFTDILMKNIQMVNHCERLPG